MLKEFKKFALKGNMLDLAIGIIIGGAFSGIVKSFVDNIIMPVLSLFTKSMDFTNLFISLDGKDYSTLAKAQEAGASTFNYGLFVTGLIDFLIMAFVIFLLVKGINKLKKKEEDALPSTKTCPFCVSEIHIDAKKCPHCTEAVE